MANMIPFLLEGLGVTLKIFFLALLFSMPLGLLVTVGRMSKHAIIRWPVRIYQLIMRGTPLMLQLVFFYYGPHFIFGFKWDRFTATIFAYTINYAAYFAEIYRGGIESIPKGQYEAGKVLGMSRSKTFFRIVLPQVVKRILPACSNEVMTLVKDTALASTIAVAELMKNANSTAVSATSVIPWVVAAAFYLLVCTVVEQGFVMVEKKLNYYQ